MNVAEARWSLKLMSYLACYGLYVVVLALGAAVFFIWPTTLVALIGAVLGHSAFNRSIYLVGMLFLGMGLFVLVMAAEPYLRGGVARGQLLRRFVRLCVPLVVTGGLGLALQGLAIAMLQ